MGKKNEFVYMTILCGSFCFIWIYVWLDQNGPIDSCFNTRFPVISSLWEGFGNVAILEDVCHWAWPSHYSRCARPPACEM